MTDNTFPATLNCVCSNSDLSVYRWNIFCRFAAIHREQLRRVEKVQTFLSVAVCNHWKVSCLHLIRSTKSMNTTSYVTCVILNKLLHILITTTVLDNKLEYYEILQFTFPEHSEVYLYPSVHNKHEKFASKIYLIFYISIFISSSLLQ